MPLQHYSPGGGRVPHGLVTANDAVCAALWLALPFICGYTLWKTNCSEDAVIECLIAGFMASLSKALVFEFVRWIRVSSLVPPRYAVWFEEASLILDKGGAHRYMRPFASLGETVITVLLTFLVFAQRIFSYDRSESWFNLYPLCCVVVVNSGYCLRCWRRTRKEYERKIRIVLRQAPQLEIMAYEVTLKFLDALAPLVSTTGTNCLLPPELMIERSEIVLEGAQRALTFVIETLKHLTTIDPSTEGAAAPKDRFGNPFPLHARWRMLNEGAKAGTAFLQQKTDAGASFVTGRKQQLLCKLVLQAQTMAGELKSRATDQLGGAADTEVDVIIGLVKAQRNMSKARKRKSKGGPGHRGKQKHQLASDSETCEEEATDPVCVSCFDDVADYAFAGCGHLCYCEACHMLVRRMACPLCRTESQMIVKSKFKGRLYLP